MTFDIVLIVCHVIFFALLGASAIAQISSWFESRFNKRLEARYFWGGPVCTAAIFLAAVFCITGGFGRWNTQNGGLQTLFVCSVATTLVVYFVREGTRQMAVLKAGGGLLIEGDDQYKPYPALIVGVIYSGFVPGCILWGLSYVYPAVLVGYMPIGRTLLLVAAILLAWDGYQHGKVPRGAQLPWRAVAPAIGMGVCFLAFLLLHIYP